MLVGGGKVERGCVAQMPHSESLVEKEEHKEDEEEEEHERR